MKFIVFPGLEENSKKNYVHEKKIRGSYNGHDPSVLWAKHIWKQLQGCRQPIPLDERV